MNEEVFQRRLAELVSRIGTLPAAERTRLQALAEETKQRHDELKRTIAGLQEGIDFLRLSIKYMIFDLEATRRENAQLRKLLDGES